MSPKKYELMKACKMILQKGKFLVNDNMFTFSSASFEKNTKCWSGLNKFHICNRATPEAKEDILRISETRFTSWLTRLRFVKWAATMKESSSSSEAFQVKRCPLSLRLFQEKLPRFVFIEKVFTILKSLYSFSSFYTHLRKLRRIEIGRLIYIVYLWIQGALSIAHIISSK